MVRTFMVLALAAAVGSCSQPEPRKHPAGATPYTEAEKAEIAAGAAVIERQSASQKADRIVACGLALVEAEKRGLVGRDSQFLRPWRLTAEPVGSWERLRCEAEDQSRPIIVVVDLKCPDVNDAKCHPLIEVTRP